MSLKEIARETDLDMAAEMAAIGRAARAAAHAWASRPAPPRTPR